MIVLEKLIIIGAGAAGLMAAGTALSLGKRVVVIDKNHRPARKVMITGKGRCNVTNACSEQEFLESVVTNPRFLYSAIHKFSAYDTMDLFENKLGVPLKIERGNRVFPLSDRAVDIVDALAKYARHAEFLYQTVVTELLVQDQKIIGVKLDNGNVVYGDSVVVATGGKSYPATGSTGDGYHFARMVGHTVIPPLPSLVSVVCHTTDCRDLMGLSLKNVTLTVTDRHKDTTVFHELGEMLFAHFGLSGPLVLSASSHMRPMEANRFEMTIDCKPALNHQQLDARILRDFHENTQRTLRNSLGKLLPAKMIPVLIKRSGISPDCKVNQITKEQRQILVSLIKGFSFQPYSFRSIDEAIITCGGVDVKEINPQTMESKLIKGLYFAGEVLDLDAYTGGYNLQIAFSTGYVAGLSA